MFKLNAKLNADFWLYSIIMDAKATQYTCSLNGVSYPYRWYSEVVIVHT